MIASRINKCRQNTFNVNSISNNPTMPYIAVINQTTGSILTSLLKYHFGNGSLTFAKQKPETAKNITSPSKPPLAIKSVGYTPV